MATGEPQLGIGGSRGSAPVPLTANFLPCHLVFLEGVPVRSGSQKMSSCPFTVDPQTLLHLKSALIGFRVRTHACPECGGDADGNARHDPNCCFGQAVRLV